MKKVKQHVFIIGSKGIPANYGGFESFVEKLTQYQMTDAIQYHVSCIPSIGEYKKNSKTFQYNNAACFNIRPLNIGPARAIAHDLEALQYCIAYIKKHRIAHPVIYVLACRIGPFIGYYKKQILKLGAVLYVNPDGHEWKRDKWSMPVQKYWKISEKYMVKHADLLICDSKNIEKYIKMDYKLYKPNTTFIAYGSDKGQSSLDNRDEKVAGWYREKGVKQKEYYLVVGRFVPENNYETMIREFMNSSTKKDFVLITGIDNNKFYEKLNRITGFGKDKRIKFVGTVYDAELLKKIRENAYGYFHGHEVGGTNPSLLEALGSTDLNLLLDVGFNKEVGEDGALYWTKNKGSLANLIHKAEQLNDLQIQQIAEKARKRITDEYSWEYIVGKYEKIFLEGVQNHG